MTEIPRVQRTALVVADIDRSLRLYRDVLGFEVAFIKSSEADSYSYPAFNIPRAASIRFATLNAGPLQPRVLGLIEVKGVDRQSPPPATRTSALVIEVAGIDSIAARLRELPGVHVLAAGSLATQDGRHGRELAVWDADGHLIVLYQIDS
jgi:catechol 2,3-dioxygenase-like lactoylglutathione lyase family enzyme